MTDLSRDDRHANTSITDRHYLRQTLAENTRLHQQITGLQTKVTVLERVLEIRSDRLLALLASESLWPDRTGFLPGGRL